MLKRLQRCRKRICCRGKTDNRMEELNEKDNLKNQIGGATICLEGNGSRPSHNGDGYIVTDKMYTLNTTEVHGVAYESYRVRQL